MKSSFNFLAITAVLLIGFWSCNKEPVQGPDASRRVLFSVDEESLSFATKASTGISVVTALNAFNVLAVTGEPDAYEAAWQTPVMAFANEGSVYANKDVLWPREDPGWTFYAFNLLEPQIASGPAVQTYLGWGDLWTHPSFIGRAQAIFDSALPHSPYLKTPMGCNPFFHPLYLMRYGRNMESCWKVIPAFQECL